MKVVQHLRGVEHCVVAQDARKKLHRYTNDGFVVSHKNPHPDDIDFGKGK